MTKEELNEYSLQIDRKAQVYWENEKYITGKNPILSEPKKKTPDNKISVPLAKATIEDLSGYACKPGNVKITYDNITTEKDESKQKNNDKDEYININKEIFELNNGSVEISKLYSECLGQGVSFELVWISNEEVEGTVLTPEYSKIPGYQVIIIDDGALKPTILKAIRKFRKLGTDYIEVYEPLFKTTYKRDKEGNWNEGIIEQYPFKAVPVAVYKANDREQSIFDAEKSMMDAYDMIMSRSINDIERFNAAIPIFKEKLAEEDAEKFRASIIDFIDKVGGIGGENTGNLPKYLEKNLAGAFTFYDGFATRILRDIRTCIKVPDWSSLSGSDLSGKAMAYILLALEFRVSEIETGFNQGLKMRQNLIDQAITASPTSNIKTDEYKMVIKWERNLPVERDTMVGVAVALQAMGISREIYLKLIPQDIIDDVEAEIARQDEEPTLDDINLTDGE